MELGEQGDLPESTAEVRLAALGEGGTDRALGELLGTRPVVLNFFASWCAPCIEEMPAFEQVHRSLGDRVAIVGMAYRDSAEDALATVARTGVTYPTYADAEGSALTCFGGTSMPATVFIDAAGEVVDVHSGALTEDALRRQAARPAGGRVIGAVGPDGPWAFYLTLGMVATVNPCGFAMLPAYLSYFLGLEDSDAEVPRAGVAEAVRVACAVSLGFLAVFAVAGTIVELTSLPVYENAPWISVVIGLALLALGVALLCGVELKSPSPGSTAAAGSARWARCSCSACPTPSPRSAARCRCSWARWPGPSAASRSPTG